MDSLAIPIILASIPVDAVILALIPVAIGIALYIYGYFKERERKEKLLEDKIRQLERKLEEKE